MHGDIILSEDDEFVGLRAGGQRIKREQVGYACLVASICSFVRAQEETRGQLAP